MPWTHPDHEKSAFDAVELGLISATVSDLADVPEPQQSSEHQARVSAITMFYELAGPDARVTTKWSPQLYDWTIVPGPEPLPEFDLVVDDTMDDIQTRVTAVGVDANIRFEPGMYRGLTIEPESGQTIVSLSAVCDGLETVTVAFGGPALAVTLAGFEIFNYQNPVQSGAIHTFVEDQPGWTVEDVNAHHNLGIGIYLTGDNATIRRCKAVYNHQLGVSLGGGKDNLIEDTELGFNNWLGENQWGFEAGGCKMNDADGIILRRVTSHDNVGPGLWCDGQIRGVVYEDNIVYLNTGPGIFHELAGDATIRRNHIYQNGWGPDGTGGGDFIWDQNGAIHISAAGPTIVEDNLVENCAKGITLIDQCRQTETPYPYDMASTIRRNVLRDSGFSGSAQDCYDVPYRPIPSVVWEESNRFEGTSYLVDR